MVHDPVAYVGIAGTGKTTRLLSDVEDILERVEMRDGQRVLATSFMHGARRRLAERLQASATIRGRYSCTTLDSFALGVCRRWQGVLVARGQEFPETEDFDGICALAAGLADAKTIGAWIATSFPVCLVDEAQDLDWNRVGLLLAMHRAGVRLFIAADEFQCLRDQGEDCPVLQWLRAEFHVTELTQIHRTDKDGIIEAATNVRSGVRVPERGAGFRLLGAPGPNPAAAFVANSILFERATSAMVLTPSKRGGYVERVLNRVGEGPIGKFRSGPYRFRWEGRATTLATTVVQLREIPMCGLCSEMIEALAGEDARLVGGLEDWLRRVRRLRGDVIVTKDEMVAQSRRIDAYRRAHGGESFGRFGAMTVHQAKNREFQHVVVVWPYTVGGTDEGKRRLLYNAITRAIGHCTVVTQGREALQRAPFV